MNKGSVDNMGILNCLLVYVRSVYCVVFVCSRRSTLASGKPWPVCILCPSNQAAYQANAKPAHKTYSDCKDDSSFSRKIYTCIVRGSCHRSTDLAQNVLGDYYFALA